VQVQSYISRSIDADILLQGIAIARQIGAMQYMECSAKTGEGVAEVFQYAARASLVTPSSSSESRGSRSCVVL
jgi:Ras family protein A